MSEEILDNEFSPIEERRRALLPTWIKVFLWIFMIFGAIVPIGLIAGIFGIDFNIALYGLETNKVYSIIGLLLVGFFAIKGAVSIGLWTEKDWAVDLAIIDAVIGIIACLVIMLATPFLGGALVSVSFRIEILLLIPYLLTMRRISGEWKSRR